MKDVSILILAGGKSQRMGENKAFLNLEGRTFINHLIQSFGVFKNQLFISGKRQDYENYGVPVIEDLESFSGKGPLSGIYSGLQTLQTNWVFVISVDSPFVSPDEMKELYSCRKENTIVISRDENQIHPLIGFYHKSLAKTIEFHLNGENKSMKGLYLNPELSTKIVQVTNPSRLKNINTPHEYKREFMEIEIGFYGELSELVQGPNRMVVSVNTTLNDFKGILIKRFPSLDQKIYKMALNNAFVDPSTVIEEHSKVDVFPAFSGG